MTLTSKIFNHSRSVSERSITEGSMTKGTDSGNIAEKAQVADSSENSPMYGWSLWRSKNIEAFRAWEMKYPEAAKNLREIVHQRQENSRYGLELLRQRPDMFERWAEKHPEAFNRLQKDPEYGLELLQQQPDKFEEWAKNNSGTFTELKHRVYPEGLSPNRINGRDLPVAQGDYMFIRNFNPSLS